MTSQPVHRRALRIEIPGVEPAQVRVGAGRRSWRVGRQRVVVALTPQHLRQVVGTGLRALSLDPQRAVTRAGLFDLLATRPDVVILSDPFDRAPALSLIATIRTGGYRGAIVVLGHASRALRAGGAALGGVTLVADPVCGATVAGPWLRRCLTAAPVSS